MTNRTDPSALRPRLDYFATGGTIASVEDGLSPGAAPALSARMLLSALPGIEALADIHCTQVLQVPSPEIGFADIFKLRDAIADAVRAGSRGVVISHGTDTMEESAFLLDLLWGGDEPVVLTGAMRNPSLPGSDGPANLLAALQTALCADARGCGALLVFNDEIHAARFVRKTHTASPATFRSPALGPIGWVNEGRPVIALRPTRRFRFDIGQASAMAPVALVKLAFDDDGRMLKSVASLGYRGLVIEAFGGGHVRREILPLLRDVVADMPVVLASRTGSGEVLSATYRFAGGEIDLLNMGLIHAGILDGLKARLLLSLCLADRMPVPKIHEAFNYVGMRAARSPTAA